MVDFVLIAPGTAPLKPHQRRPGFHVGDLVTRDGTDIHRVTGHNGDDQYEPDLITVVCVKAPASGWCEVGDVEDNLPRRYEYLPAIDAVREER